MNFAYQLVDKLLQNPTKPNLLVLNKALMLGIPFNAPHGFKILEATDTHVQVALPNRKLNHNHLGGIHACAIATAGEFSAGISLLSTFGMAKCRIIMSELNVKYTYQGRTDLTATCKKAQVNTEALAQTLDEKGQFIQTMVTQVLDKHGKDVATVTTTWQVKIWEKVRTKG
jgi:acyl-coenzyme A thioesterase PaaI-like protein